MRTLLKELTERLIRSYQDATDERRTLAEEWRARGEQATDLLLEAELLTDKIAGLTSQISRRSGPRDPDGVYAQLIDASVFANPVLVRFLLQKESEFPRLCTHLLWAESLRSAGLLALASESGNRGPAGSRSR